jgi:hypothetical protein
LYLKAHQWGYGKPGCARISRLLHEVFMPRRLSVVAPVAGSLFVFNAAALPKGAFGEVPWQAISAGRCAPQPSAIGIDATAGGSNSTVLPVRIQMINLAREKGR